MMPSIKSTFAVGHFDALSGKHRQPRVRDVTCWSSGTRNEVVIVADSLMELRLGQGWAFWAAGGF